MEAKVKADKNIIRIIKGSVFSILITLILLFIYAILLTSTNIPESTMSVVVITITGIIILIGSSISSFKIKKRGIVNGGLVGLIYIITIYLISSIALMGFSMNITSIIMLIVAIVIGMIGGIIGVNL